MKLSELIYESEAIRILGDLRVEITNITTSPDDYSADTLLVLLKNNLVHEKGDLLGRFSAIICNTEVFEHLAETLPCTVVCVESVRRAWAMAESRQRRIDYRRLTFIAVTGTNGKSTTASLIKEMLEFDGKRVGIIGTGVISVGDESIRESEYYSMTTPDPPMLYKAIKEMELRGATHVVMEVSSHALYYEKTAAIRFALSVFTNLSPEHLDLHGSMEEYLSIKLRLAEQSDEVLFAADDPHFRTYYHTLSLPKRSYAILWDADYRATDICDRGFDGAEFIFRGPNLSFSATSRLIGRFNIYNAVAALSAAISVGVAPCMAKRALLGYKGTRGRCETVYNGDIRVIIDYAHTEAAFTALLCDMKKYSRGRLSVLFGCGGERYVGKRRIMAKIAEEYAARIYVTSDNPRGEAQSKISADIISGFSGRVEYTLIENRAEAIYTAITEASAGDTVLLVGKGWEPYNIDATGYHRFDEREEVARAMEARRRLNESET